MFNGQRGIVSSMSVKCRVQTDARSYDITGMHAAAEQLLSDVADGVQEITMPGEFIELGRKHGRGIKQY